VGRGWSITGRGEDLTDSTSTKGLGTEGISDSRTSVESLSGGWFIVESTESILRVWTISDIFDTKNIGGSSSILFEGESNRGHVSNNTLSSSDTSSL